MKIVFLICGVLLTIKMKKKSIKEIYHRFDFADNKTNGDVQGLQ